MCIEDPKTVQQDMNKTEAEAMGNDRSESNIINDMIASMGLVDQNPSDAYSSQNHGDELSNTFQSKPASQPNYFHPPAVNIPSRRHSLHSLFPTAEQESAYGPDSSFGRDSTFGRDSFLSSVGSATRSGSFTSQKSRLDGFSPQDDQSYSGSQDDLLSVMMTRGSGSGLYGVDNSSNNNNSIANNGSMFSVYSTSPPQFGSSGMTPGTPYDLTFGDLAHNVNSQAQMQQAQPGQAHRRSSFTAGVQASSYDNCDQGRLQSHAYHYQQHQMPVSASSLQRLFSSTNNLTHTADTPSFNSQQHSQFQQHQQQQQQQQHLQFQQQQQQSFQRQFINNVFPNSSLPRAPPQHRYSLPSGMPSRQTLGMQQQMNTHSHTHTALQHRQQVSPQALPQHMNTMNNMTRAHTLSSSTISSHCSTPSMSPGNSLCLSQGAGVLHDFEDSVIEELVASTCRDILVEAANHTLKAVELANTLRARVGTEVLANIRERWGGLLALLEKHSSLFRVDRIPKNDLVTLLSTGPSGQMIRRTASSSALHTLHEGSATDDDQSSAVGQMPMTAFQLQQMQQQQQQHQHLQPQQQALFGSWSGGGGGGGGSEGVSSGAPAGLTRGGNSYDDLTTLDVGNINNNHVSRCLHVGNVPASMSDRDLKREFEKFGGEVEGLKLISQRSRRFAFISFRAVEQAVLAKQMMSRMHPWKSAISFAHKEGSAGCLLGTNNNVNNNNNNAANANNSGNYNHNQGYVLEETGRCSPDAFLQSSYSSSASDQQQQQQQYLMPAKQQQVPASLSPDATGGVSRRVTPRMCQQAAAEEAAACASAGGGREQVLSNYLCGDVQPPSPERQSDDSVFFADVCARRPSLPSSSTSPELASLQMQHMQQQQQQQLNMCPVLRRLCDDTYVPSCSWPVDVARDSLYCNAVIAQLIQFGGSTTISKLRGFLRNRVNATDNIKSVPLKAMLAAYPHLFMVRNNQVALVLSGQQQMASPPPQQHQQQQQNHLHYGNFGPMSGPAHNSPPAAVTSHSLFSLDYLSHSLAHSDSHTAPAVAANNNMLR